MSVYPTGKPLFASAIVSKNEYYRYELMRIWGNPVKRTMVVIGVNPSTADAKKDDPTIRRCVGLAQVRGCQRLVMLNVYAYRSTDPKRLRRIRNPVGPENDAVFKKWAFLYVPKQMIVVAAWGNGISLLSDGEYEAALALRHFPRVWCWGRTEKGYPRHPLFIPRDTPLVEYAYHKE